MNSNLPHRRWLSVGVSLLILVVALAGCTSGPVPASSPAERVDPAQAAVLAIPDLQPAALDGRPLRVVATTSIIGDVVAQVGNGDIELTTLMDAGLDPHSYQPAPRDLTAVAKADVIFVNGWDLEESLISDLQNVAGSVPIVPISANIMPLPAGHAALGEAGQLADPHVWLAVANVKQWVENVDHVFSTLDPARAEQYHRRAADYQSELDRLEENTLQALQGIPQEKRFLVTNHDSLAYFATAYGFTVVGTVIPGVSTLAEPSAGDLADLVAKMNEAGVCAIIAETTTSSALAGTVAAELDRCDQVHVVQLYTGSLGPPGSGADSYLGMIGSDVTEIVEALK